MLKEGESIAQYTRTKLEADEDLTVWGDERREKNDPGGGFRYIIPRPGILGDEEGTGRWS